MKYREASKGADKAKANKPWDLITKLRVLGTVSPVAFEGAILISTLIVDMVW